MSSKWQNSVSDRPGWHLTVELDTVTKCSEVSSLMSWVTLKLYEYSGPNFHSDTSLTTRLAAKRRGRLAQLIDVKVVYLRKAIADDSRLLCHVSSVVELTEKEGN